MKCTVRAALPSDEPFLREMLYLALYVPPGQEPFPRSILRDPSISRYVEGWGSGRGDTGLIALVDGERAGAVWLRCFPATEPGYGFVDEDIPELSIAVLPCYRDQGIGTFLMAQVIRDNPAISLSCDPGNPAWRLYERAGFQPQECGRVMLRTGAAATPPSQDVERVGNALSDSLSDRGFDPLP